MTDNGQTVELRLDARAENLALARLALAGVAANAGASREVVSDLKLAVTEACTNVIQHAYPDGENGEIVVRYTVAEGELAIEVEDTGVGFEPAAQPGDADGTAGPRHGPDDHPCPERRADDLEHQLGNPDRVREAVQPGGRARARAGTRRPRRASRRS